MPACLGVKTGTAAEAELKEQSLGRKPNQQQAAPTSEGEENPLGTGNTFPSRSVFLYVRNKELRMMRTASCFGTLPHYKRGTAAAVFLCPSAPGMAVPSPQPAPLLTGRRRARTAPGTRAPAARRRCGQSKEKRGTFNTAGPWGERVRGKEDIHYQREQLSAFSSRPSAARVWDQECAMGGAAGQRGLLGAGWLPERPRSASLIAALTSPEPSLALPPSAPPAAAAAPNPPPAATAQARRPRALPALSVSRAPGAGRGRP